MQHGDRLRHGQPDSLDRVELLLQPYAAASDMQAKHDRKRTDMEHRHVDQRKIVTAAPHLGVHRQCDPPQFVVADNATSPHRGAAGE